MNEAEVQATLQIIQTLLPLGIAAGEIIFRAVRAIRGEAVSAEELAADIAWLKQDAAFRESLSQMASGGLLEDLLAA